MAWCDAQNATALNFSPYAKGAWIHDDKGRNYTVVEEEHWGKDGKAVRLVTIRDEATKQTKEVPTPELFYRFHMGEAESCRKCGNAALNFSPGDKVSIVDTDIRYGGDKGEVVRKDGFRYVVRLTSRLDKPEVLLQPNQLKAANSEDAQGHEHGSDGKFASKGGGSDGGDSYEDPKTKRMKEHLAKMREKNEALRKEIDQRKAALAGKKEEIEKMRADVMKANVEKWKAGLPKTTNSVVAKALNAVAKNADEYVIRKAFTPGKWLLERKMKSLGDAGSVKAFSSEDEARAYAKSKGLSVVNAIARNDWEQTYEIKGLPVVLTYRGSPFNDIKATIKGGNRDWIEVARVVASSPVSQAEAEKMVAPKWSRIKRTAPNAVAKNWSYKNNYQWFAIREPMSGKCILAGNEFREDAMDVIKEEKEQTGKSYKLVSRRTLERAGIDPNSRDSWIFG